VPSVIVVVRRVRRESTEWIGRQRAETAVDGLGDGLRARIEGLLERLQLGVKRGIEVGHAAVQRDFELRKALVHGSGDLAAVRGQTGIEVVDIGLQAVGDVLGALAQPLDDLAAEGLDGAVELRDVAGNQRAERAAVAGEFFRQFGTLVLHQFVEGAHLQRERIVRGLGLADDLGDQRIHGNIERLAGLVAGGEDVGGEAIAGFVDLVDEVAAAQLEFQ
jgi:hypothetical protein